MAVTDDTTLATKADLRRTEVALREEMHAVGSRLEDGIGQVLTVLVGVEKKLPIIVQGKSHGLAG